MKGYVQVYTGDGKGKTTAAIGLAMRAVGAGKRVWLLQFMKSKAYSEHAILPEVSPLLTVETLGKPYFIAKEGTLSEADKRALGEVVVFAPGNPPADYVADCRAGVEKARRGLASGDYDVVILDEIIVALYFELISRADVESLLAARPVSTELVLTGRRAPDWLIERADLVTEMVPVKHYFEQGVANRKGIED